MEAKSTSKNIRTSPQKVRRLINKVRGLKVQEAIDLMHFTAKRAAEPVEKTIRTAVANLMEADNSIRENQIFIKSIYADEGMKLKRVMPRAMGRAARITKRSTHLTVIVTTK